MPGYYHSHGGFMVIRARARARLRPRLSPYACVINVAATQSSISRFLDEANRESREPKDQLAVTVDSLAHFACLLVFDTLRWELPMIPRQMMQGPALHRRIRVIRHSRTMV